MGLKTGRGVELLQGEAFTLQASAVKTSGTGAAMANQWDVYGERARYIFMLILTAAGAEVGSTLDVFIDALGPDATTWINCAHFPQITGITGVPLRQVAVLDATAVAATTFDVTSDCAVGVTKPYVFGQSFRGRYTIVNGGTPSFTFAAYGYAIGSRV